jgi:hypothetical protein
MKKALLLIPAAALMFSVSSCKKEVPEQEINNISTAYKAFVFEQSATWCGSCGAVGYPTFKQIVQDFHHDITPINLHTQDSIDGSPAGGYSLQSFYDISGIPACAVNMSKSFFPSIEDLTDSINFFSAQHPRAKAGIGFSMKIEGSNMVVNTKTVAFEALTGRYSLAVYLTEDKIMEEQNGQSGEVEFNHVFRGAANGAAWGSMIIQTSCEAGAEFDKSFTIPISNRVRNRDNLHVAVLLFKIDPATSKPIDVINTNHN